MVACLAHINLSGRTIVAVQRLRIQGRSRVYALAWWRVVSVASWRTLCRHQTGNAKKTGQATRLREAFIVSARPDINVGPWPRRNRRAQQSRIERLIYLPDMAALTYLFSNSPASISVSLKPAFSNIGRTLRLLSHSSGSILPLRFLSIARNA